jgi:hypothetical protein
MTLHCCYGDLLKYSEMIDMLYSSTTFSFIGLYSRNTSQRLNTIKSLHISWIILFPSHANGEQALELEENYSLTPSQVQWENVCHVIGTMAFLFDVKFTIYNAKTSPKLLLPLWTVRVEKFLVGLSYSKNLDTVGAPFQVRMLASQDNQISCQLEKSP